jgi:hypothetical protein
MAESRRRTGIRAALMGRGVLLMGLVAVIWVWAALLVVLMV